MYYIRAFQKWVGSDAIAVMLIVVGTILLLIPLLLMTRRIIPAIAESLRTYVERRAREVFDDSWLRFHGFRFATCMISVVFGVAFYGFVKTAMHFPDYWKISLGNGLVLFIGFTTWGIVSAPRVRLRSFLKHFFIPVGSAVGVLLFNALVEFGVAVAVAVGNLLS
jgi:hypothetical protein